MDCLERVPESMVDVHEHGWPHSIIHCGVQAFQLLLGVMRIQLNNAAWRLWHFETTNSFWLIVLLVGQLKEILEFHRVKHLVEQA